MQNGIQCNLSFVILQKHLSTNLYQFLLLYIIKKACPMAICAQKVNFELALQHSPINTGSPAFVYRPIAARIKQRYLLLDS